MLAKVIDAAERCFVIAWEVATARKARLSFRLKKLRDILLIKL
jgi:hypothetical protein